MFTKAEINNRFSALNLQYLEIANATKYDRGFYDKVAKYLYDVLGLTIDSNSLSADELSELLSLIANEKTHISTLQNSFLISAAAIATTMQTLKDGVVQASISAAASGRVALSAAVSASTAWDGVRAARLEIFDTKEQIEQSVLSAEEKLAAVRTEAAAALELLQESAAEGVDAVGIAKQSALSALSDKQNIAAATVDTAANVAVLRIEQTKDGARTSISGLAQGLTDGLIAVRRNILDDIGATASDVLDDIGTKIDDANAAAALAVSKTATLNTVIDTANTALVALHDPQTDMKLLYVSASGALYTAAAQSAHTETLIQRAIASLHTYTASVYAAEAEADRVEIAGYKGDITAMMAQMQTLLDNTKTAEQNAEFIALKEAFD